MSTLKTTNLQHPSAGVPAIVLDADGDATYAGVHDFSAATVTGAPQGLVHIATESFSAVSSVSLDNVFTSNYENYKMLINVTSTGTTNFLRLRLRASSTDNTDSTYRWVIYYYEAETPSAGFNGSGWNVNTLGINLNRPYQLLSVFEVMAPNSTAVTQFHGFGGVGALGFPVAYNGFKNDSNQYDGLTLYPDGGAITGTIRVYGYRNEA